MAEEIFPSLFRRRQQLIHEADAAVAEANRIMRLRAGGAEHEPIKNAADQCEHAAELYLKAGLGLLAKEQFAAASRYYSLCGDRERTRLNQERWTAVSTYWDDDGNA